MSILRCLKCGLTPQTSFCFWPNLQTRKRYLRPTFCAGAVRTCDEAREGCVQGIKLANISLQPGDLGGGLEIRQRRVPSFLKVVGKGAHIWRFRLMQARPELVSENRKSVLNKGSQALTFCGWNFGHG